MNYTNHRYKNGRLLEWKMCGLWQKDQEFDCSAVKPFEHRIRTRHIVYKWMLGWIKKFDLNWCNIEDDHHTCMSQLLECSRTKHNILQFHCSTSNHLVSQYTCITPWQFIIIIYFENIHFFHVQLGSDICPDMKFLPVSLNIAYSGCKTSSFMSLTLIILSQTPCP